MLNKGRIIIVDDDTLILNLLEDILTEKSYEIVKFQTSTDALLYAYENPPDLFLLDINMPDINGIDLCREIKKRPALQTSPVIFISGILEAREKALGFEVGGADYITKPFIAMDVLSRVKTHINLKKSMEEILNFNKNLEKEIRKRTGELEKAKEEAEKANEAKSLFISQINHELRTPLNGILGMFSLLKKDEKDEERKELYLDLADYAAKHLSFLINDMLDYTQLENRSMRFRYAPFSVASLFKRLNDMFTPLCREKEMLLEICHPDNPCFFTGDEDRFLQIMNNLLTNAVKYASKGKIMVSYSCKEGQINVAVSDEGPGIPEDIKNDVFKPFVQKNTLYLRGQGGLGLGLAITHSLITAMDGSIDFESSREGTFFHFHLPEHPKNIAPSKEPETVLPLPPLSILLVEDDPVSIYYLERILEDAECRVTQVINGTEALEELSDNSFDLILMDIGLPEISGLQVIQQIRKINKDFRIPVLAVTAYCRKEDVERFLQAGFSDVLAKPVREPDLMVMIRKYAAINEKM